jgi:hypothetical protein
MKFKINARTHLIFTTGAAFLYEAGETVDVHESMAQALIAHGATELTDDETPIGPTAEEVAAARKERAEIVAAAVQTVINEGDLKKFDHQGVPRGWALQEHTGFPVSAPEVKEAFETVTGDGE